MLHSVYLNREPVQASSHHRGAGQVLREAVRTPAHRRVEVSLRQDPDASTRRADLLGGLTMLLDQLRQCLLKVGLGCIRLEKVGAAEVGGQTFPRDRVPLLLVRWAREVPRPMMFLCATDGSSGRVDTL